MRILRGNIAFAILTKVVFFVLALAGVATLWMAVFADMGASLLVVLNGYYLVRNQPMLVRMALLLPTLQRNHVFLPHLRHHLPLHPHLRLHRFDNRQARAKLLRPDREPHCDPVPNERRDHTTKRIRPYRPVWLLTSDTSRCHRPNHKDAE